MKHLKTFESFRFNESNEYPSAEEMKAHLCDCGYTPEECDEMSYEEMCDCWEECNAMANEKKKIPAGLQAYLDKKKKSSKSTDSKKSKGEMPEMPDFPDVDKDGDKKEPITKAAKEAEAKKKK